MTNRLRALLIEDAEDDARLLLRELQRAGYELVYRRVETSAGLLTALQEEPWDVVLSDYALPGFDAPTALRIVKQHQPETPFIVVSGTVSEEVAVDAMRAGAADYIAKGRLARLIPAIERERRESAAQLERRRAEEARRRAEESFRALIEASPDIIVVQCERKIRYVNPAAARMLGSELCGRSVEDLIHPEERSKILDLIAGELAPSMEQRWRRADGTALWVDVSARSLVFEGEPALMLIARDISERKQVQAQLMVSDRMASVGMLAAGVAHEINNPLAAVIANLELAARDLITVSDNGAVAGILDLEEDIKEAREAAERVRLIVRDLKIFSRGEEERRGPVDLRRVIESSLRMAWNEIRHRARLVKDYEEIPMVDGSESRLGQVFLNLIVNAAHAIPEGRADRNEIRIKLGTDPSGRILSQVTDTGTGMSAEVLRHLFTPFFTTKAVGVGTGLGLSICQRIVQSHGGTIEVDSLPGRGTTFRVFLPVSGDVQPSVPPLRRSNPPMRRARLLVVDDEAPIGRAIQRSLGGEHDVDTLTSARIALQRIVAGERFDVILCDLMMPDMTGMELHAELMTAHPDQANRIIFVTGGAFTPSARAFLDEVSNLRLEKPFDISQLLAVISDRVRS